MIKTVDKKFKKHKKSVTPGKAIIFWDFDDRMYLVHKDPSDRLWGTAMLSELGHRFLYSLR